jgi:hypothetical protein
MLERIGLIYPLVTLLCTQNWYLLKIVSSEIPEDILTIWPKEVRETGCHLCFQAWLMCQNACTMSLDESFDGNHTLHKKWQYTCACLQNQSGYLFVRTNLFTWISPSFPSRSGSEVSVCGHSVLSFWDRPWVKTQQFMSIFNYRKTVQYRPLFASYHTIYQGCPISISRPLANSWRRSLMK